MGQHASGRMAENVEAAAAPIAVAQGGSAQSEPRATDARQGMEDGDPSTPKRGKARFSAEEKISEPRPDRPLKTKPDTANDSHCKHKVAANPVQRISRSEATRRSEATAAAVADAAQIASAAREKTLELEAFLEVRRAQAELSRIACMEMAEQAQIAREMNASRVVRQLHWSVERAAAHEGREDTYWYLGDDEEFHLRADEWAPRQPVEDAWGDVEDPVTWDRKLQSSSVCHGMSGILEPVSPKRARNNAVTPKTAGNGATAKELGKRRRTSVSL
mmetsp:Transcript_8500/g.16122  ORF Transcript_8500/g.16122 Transcript_8500/m.16122 type:complete len:275 (-) Transcript_8500:155-979(-)